jgi:hypothetical protein
MKPLRKLTLSRKRSKASIGEQTPPVPDLPKTSTSGAATPPAGTPPLKSPTKSRPPESYSAGTAAIGTLASEQAAKPKDGSVRSKKNAPSAYNGVGAGHWVDQSQPGDGDESPRRRKSSLA